MPPRVSVVDCYSTASDISFSYSNLQDFFSLKTKKVFIIFQLIIDCSVLLISWETGGIASINSCKNRMSKSVSRLYWTYLSDSAKPTITINQFCSALQVQCTMYLQSVKYPFTFIFTYQYFSNTLKFYTGMAN